MKEVVSNFANFLENGDVIPKIVGYMGLAGNGSSNTQIHRIIRFLFSAFQRLLQFFVNKI